MQYNQEAYNEFKKAKSSYDAVQVVGFVGGFLIEWPVGTALRGGDPQWGLAGVGAGLILISIPLSSGFSTHAIKAVEIYKWRSENKRQAIGTIFFYTLCRRS